MNFPFCRPLMTSILLAVVSAAVGCAQTAESASEEQLHERKRKEFDEHIHPRHDLMAIACLYLDWEEKQHRPPSAASDLHGHGAMDARALQRLRQGRYAFLWGMDLRALPPSERSQLVLGYETTPSARGTRLVVTADAQVREVSEREFEQAVADASGTRNRDR